MAAYSLLRSFRLLCIIKSMSGLLLIRKGKLFWSFKFGLKCLLSLRRNHVLTELLLVCVIRMYYSKFHYSKLLIISAYTESKKKCIFLCTFVNLCFSCVYCEISLHYFAFIRKFNSCTYSLSLIIVEPVWILHAQQQAHLPVTEHFTSNHQLHHPPDKKRLYGY
jgi:hypothetical protein